MIPEEIKSDYEIGVDAIKELNDIHDEKLAKLKDFIENYLPESLWNLIKHKIVSPDQTLFIIDRRTDDNRFVMRMNYNESAIDKIHFEVYDDCETIVVCDTLNPYIALAVFYGAEPPKS